MFGKNATKQMETIIGAESTVRGELSIRGTVRIDGTVEGDIEAGFVVVGETGAIRGNIRSTGTVVGGRIDGNIDSNETVELKNSARVLGEIRTAKLVMSEGALFDGLSCMKQKAEGSEVPEGKIAHLKSMVSGGEE
ncbi:MAG: polymer-forming cytoskeletal protein [Deltaproteobacteria bacterium]